MYNYEDGEIEDGGEYWIIYSSFSPTEKTKKGDRFSGVLKACFEMQEEEKWINKILIEETVTMDELHFYHSHGESILASLAKAYFVKNYSAIVEYNECKNPKNGRFLPYDVFIPKYNIYIEINGSQHYNIERKYHKKQEDFEYQLYKDKIKKEHAERNGYFVEIRVGRTEDIKNNNVITRVLKIISEIENKRVSYNDFSI
jgi:hypothetical protein